MESKTIIISSQDENIKGRGILTIYIEDGLLKSKIRLYNTPKLNRFCKLGIYHQNEVFSANLLEKNGSYTSSMVGDFDMKKDFYAAIVDTANNNLVILSGGTYAGYFFNDQSSVFSRIEKENPNTNIFNYDETNEFLDFSQGDSEECLHTANHSQNNNKQIFAENDNQEEVNIAKNNNFNECVNECKNTEQNPCANCKYKEFFYSHQELIDTSSLEDSFTPSHFTQNNVSCYTDQPNEDEISKQNTPLCQGENSILNSLVPQFEYVFENYPADEILNNLIPNSKFVKINENKEQYSIGAIFENEEIKVICYAVKKDYNSPAPQELGEHYQWLPIDKEDPLSEGYYIVFQDTTDLKIVEM